MDKHRNPYVLDLAISRFVGWAWWFVLFGFGLGWATDTLPSEVSNHVGRVLLVVVLMTLVLSAIERALVKFYVKYEEAYYRGKYGNSYHLPCVAKDFK